MNRSKSNSFLLFVAFVVVAALLWFLFRYNNIYEEYSEVRIKWTNIPVDVKLQEEYNTLDVPVKIRASGFTLLWMKYTAIETTLNFDDYVVQKEGDYIFEPQTARNTIDRSMGGNVDIVEINSTSIKIPYERFKSKTVPLIKDFKINFQGNYQMVGKSKFDVPVVKITGNDQLISSLDKIEVNIEDVTVDDTLKIVTIDLNKLYPNIKADPETVNYIIKADQMTEGSFKIPVTLIGKSQDVSVQLIPDVVTIVYSSRLADYDSILKEDFKATVDLSDIDNGETTVVPQLEYSNARVNEARVQPPSIQILVIQ